MWRPLLPGLGCAAALTLATSCDRAAPAPPVNLPDSLGQVVVAPVQVAIQPTQYPNLSADAPRRAVLAAYLEAWNRRNQDLEALGPARERFLALYADVYRQHGLSDSDSAGLDARMRLLWDLAGVAHATFLAPAEIKRASAWVEPPPAAPSSEPPVALASLQSTPLLVPLDRLPDLTRQLLSEVPLDAPGGSRALDIVTSAARVVYFTPQLAAWSPGCPMDVCGSSEPLTRTLILTPVSQIDLAPKPDWSLAAVAVHEAAHIAWFHRPETSAEPRLLLPVPNEREAWRQTAQFLRGLLRSSHPQVRPYVQAHADAIRALLQQARDQVRRANQRLHLAEGDETLRTDLPPGTPDEALRALPR